MANKGQQGSKDSDEKRVNFDNERESKFDKEYQRKSSNQNRNSAKTKGSSNRRRRNGNNKASGRGTASSTVKTTTTNPGALLAAANFWSTYVTGAKLPFLGYTGASGGQVPTYQTVPGIMTIYWSPSFASAQNNVLQQAKESQYSFQVHANSRNESYNANDLFMLNWAGANCFWAIALLERVYGVMRNWNGLDEYTPNALISAMGFNPQDCRENYNKMVSDINFLISRTRQIWIPNNMPIVGEFFASNLEIYKDGSSPKCQYYMFVPIVLHELDEDTGAFRLTPVDTYTSAVEKTETLNWVNAVEMVNSMIDKLMTATNRGMIFGDAYKAYGPQGLFAIPEIDFSFTVVPTYDQVKLMQIENSTATGLYQGNITEDINTNRILQAYAPVSAISSGTSGVIITSNVNSTFQAWRALPLGCPRQQVLNVHQLESISPMQIIQSLEYKSFGRKLGEFICEPVSTNYKMVSYYSITAFAIRQTGGTIVGHIPFTNWGVTSSVTAGGHTVQPVATMQGSASAGLGTGNVFGFTQNYLAFDWAPWLYKSAGILAYSDSISPDDQVIGDPEIEWVTGDWDNFTIIDQTEAERIHNAMMLDAFGVPIG